MKDLPCWGAIPTWQAIEQGGLVTGVSPGVREVQAADPRPVRMQATSREVAEALVLSERTVARHLANLYAKTGVTTRPAATTDAHRHRLPGQPA